MRLTEFLISENQKDMAKQSEAALQAVWAEQDPDKKYAKAKSYINNLKFKKKIPTHLRKLEGMKGNATRIDTLVGGIQLKGEGEGVI